MSFAEAHQLARSLGAATPPGGSSSMDTAYDPPWSQQPMSGLANVIYTTKAEPMVYNASNVLK